MPTGTIVTATEQRSQHQNKAMAWKRLEQRLQPVDTRQVIDTNVQWNWCDWRDEVKLPNGKTKRMRAVLRKGLQ